MHMRALIIQCCFHSFYIVCCCGLLQDCFGAPPQPPPPIGVAPPQAQPQSPPRASEPFQSPPDPLAVSIGHPEWANSGPPGSPRGSPPGLPHPY